MRTPKDRGLGIALREARQEREVSIRHLGMLIDRTPGEISHWESGDRPLSPERAAQILTALGVNGQRYNEIIALAYDGKNAPWVATTLPERKQQMAALIEFERNASSIVDVCPLLMPGLLQEYGYAEAVMTGGGVPESEVYPRIATRMARQGAITCYSPVRFEAFIGEAVLHQQVGSSTVMVAQLGHLLRMSRRANVELRLVPYSSGWQPALEGAFTLIESRESGSVVQLENRRTTLFLHDPADIGAYRDAAQQLADLALGTEETRNAITRVKQGWERLSDDRGSVAEVESKPGRLGLR